MTEDKAAQQKELEKLCWDSCVAEVGTAVTLCGHVSDPPEEYHAAEVAPYASERPAEGRRSAPI